MTNRHGNKSEALMVILFIWCFLGLIAGTAMIVFSLVSALGLIFGESTQSWQVFGTIALGLSGFFVSYVSSIIMTNDRL